MDKVSRPLVGLLLATVGLAGTWVAVLRPHSANHTASAPAVAPAPAPAVSHHASTKSVVTKAPAKPAVTATGPSAWVLNALNAKKTVVLLFAGTGSDDNAARGVVHAVHAKNVVTRVVGIGQLGAYDDVTRGLDISATPTILVIGSDRQAREIDGLPDLKQVQAALRSVR